MFCFTLELFAALSSVLSIVAITFGLLPRAVCTISTKVCIIIWSSLCALASTISAVLEAIIKLLKQKCPHYFHGNSTPSPDRNPPTAVAAAAATPTDGNSGGAGQPPADLMIVTVNVTTPYIEPSLSSTDSNTPLIGEPNDILELL